MNQTNKTVIALMLLAALIAVNVSGQNEKAVLLIVNNSGNGWPDCSIEERLTRTLGARDGLFLVDPERAADLSQRLEGRFDRQLLLSEGQAAKYRYILWCDVVKQQLAIEAGFSLPVLLRQKRVRATLEVEYHVLDCNRGRIVGSDRIRVRRNGPSGLQCLDFTDADPNLLMPYVEKKALFDRLEDDAAKKLIAAFDDIARRR